MKDIHSIDIEGNTYAVGLAWEEVSYTKTSNLNNDIKSLAKKKNNDLGCKILQSNRKQIGFAKSNNKGQTVAACLVTKYLKDVLYVKKINNADYWACYVDTEGLIANGKEGVFDESGLLDIIDDLKMVGSLTIACSEIDKKDLFEDEEDFEVKVLEFKDIISSVKRTSDDTVGLLYKERNIVKLGGTAAVLVIALGAGYYFLYNEDPLYTEITNQELSTPLAMKQDKLDKAIKANKEAVMNEKALNAGKKMLLEKVETNIYTKEEIYNNLKKMSEVYPFYLNEWELDSLQYIKAENNSDVKFSVVYKRITSSLGYYSEIHENVTKLTKEKLNPLKMVAYPGDLNNDIIIIDLYFKEPLKIETAISEEDKLKEIARKTAETQKKIENIKEAVASVELKVSQEFGFIQKRFGSSLQDAADEIDSEVQRGSKLYDELIALYVNPNKETINVPEDYYNGSKRTLLNQMQEYSYYSWQDDKKPTTLPLPPAPDKNNKKVFEPFAKVWAFNVSSGDYTTQGVDSIKNIFAILNKTAIGIYTVNYKTENETWYIKGELYEKN